MNRGRGVRAFVPSLLRILWPALKFDRALSACQIKLSVLAEKWGQS